MANIDHDWQFLASMSGDSPKLVVVCSKCGLTRSGNVPTSQQHDHYVDLRGDCSDEPRAATTGPEPRA